MSGAMVSAMSGKVRMFDSVKFPPVSVARTCTESVDAPAASAGASATKSCGNDALLDTTTPFTISSTLRTCTSSLSVRLIGSERPSMTCTPGVAGSASTMGLVMLTVGAMPAASKAR